MNSENNKTICPQCGNVITSDVCLRCGYNSNRAEIEEEISKDSKKNKSAESYYKGASVTFFLFVIEYFLLLSFVLFFGKSFGANFGLDGIIGTLELCFIASIIPFFISLILSRVSHYDSIYKLDLCILIFHLLLLFVEKFSS